MLNITEHGTIYFYHVPWNLMNAALACGMCVCGMVRGSMTYSQYTHNTVAQGMLNALTSSEMECLTLLARTIRPCLNYISSNQLTSIQPHSQYSTSVVGIPKPFPERILHDQLPDCCSITFSMTQISELSLFHIEPVPVTAKNSKEPFF